MCTKLTCFGNRKAQLEYKLKQWGFRRNLDEKSWRQLDCTIRQRKEEGKETVVTSSFKRLDPAKVEKETNRYREWRSWAVNIRCEYSFHSSPVNPRGVHVA